MFGRKKPAPPPEEPLDERIRKLLDRLAIEEAILNLRNKK